MDSAQRRWLAQRGLEEADLEEWGVEVVSSALRFPVRGVSGDTLFYVERNFGDGQKYLFSPEHCRPSAALFGLDRALESIERSDVAIVVEGIADAMAVRKSGIEYVVSSMTASLSAIQLAVLRAFASTIIVLFDGDEAGANAAKRLAGDGVMGATISGMDPAAFVARGGRAGWIVDRLLNWQRHWEYIEVDPRAWDIVDGVAT